MQFFIWEKWLGWEDSNLRYTLPKSVALPLGYTPTARVFTMLWRGDQGKKAVENRFLGDPG